MVYMVNLIQDCGGMYSAIFGILRPLSHTISMVPYLRIRGFWQAALNSFSSAQGILLQSIARRKERNITS